jgi:hypothetical protein
MQKDWETGIFAERKVEQVRCRVTGLTYTAARDRSVLRCASTDSPTRGLKSMPSSALNSVSAVSWDSSGRSVPSRSSEDALLDVSRRAWPLTVLR